MTTVIRCIICDKAFSSDDFKNATKHIAEENAKFPLERAYLYPED